MTDEPEMVRAVLLNPADDTPRLVYADWLEETAGGVPCGRCKGKGRVWVADGPYGYDRSREPCDGCSGTGTVPNHHADRAEFIRDCCNTLARHTDCPVRLADLKSGRPVPLRCGGCDYCLVRRRAERFYARHQWLTGVPYAVCFEPTPLDGDIPTGPGLTLVVRRGFVEEVRCSAADWLAHADALAWRPGLTDECGNCKGAGVVGGYYGDNITTPVDYEEYDCQKCTGTGRVPRPLHPTAQPIRKVTLTTMPEPERVAGDGSGQRYRLPGRAAVYQPSSVEWQADIVRALLRAEWPWIKFTHVSQPT